MEVRTEAAPWMARLKGFFYKEPQPLQTKRDIHWKRIAQCAGGAIGAFVLGVLLLPSPTPEATVFHEKADPGSTSPKAANQENDPTRETLAQLQAARVNANAVPSSLDHLYQTASGGGPGASGSQGDRSASMVLMRGGQESRNQLPPGSRIPIRLVEPVIVAGQAMPVTGTVTREVVQENSVAIPEGAKVLGEVSFDSSVDRAQVTWRSIIFPDGRERPVQAIGVGLDGHIGVEGKVHSEAIKNTIGQTLTRFIGAYAEGSMSRGQFGAAEGGHENGVKNAIAATAKDRAEAWAEDMKQEKRWIELQAGAESLVVLNQPFVFRDPGATYGH
jgi:type IV secretory pathway VirB10-like protein